MSQGSDDMKRRSQLASLGLTILLIGCSNTAQQSQTPTAQPITKVPQAGVPTQAQSFPKPVVSPAAIVTVRPVPGLLQSTNARARVPGITTGRSDPFAATTSAPLVVPIATMTSKSRLQPTPRQPSTITLSPLPLLPGTSPTLTPLPPLPAPNSTAALPSTLVAPPPSPTALADAVEVSGAIQIKGKWHVIVKEPDGETSRYVSTGAYLANGKVLVKKIIAGGQAEPIVILQQGGIEVSKSIGSSGGPLAQRS